MKSIGLFICLTVIGTVRMYAADKEWLSGEIQDDKGNVTKIHKIDADGKLSGVYQGKHLSIAFKKLKRVDHVSGRTLRVTNLANKVFTLENCWLYTNEQKHGSSKGCKLVYTFYDEISMEEKSHTMTTSWHYAGNQKDEYYLHRIKALSFNGAIGKKRYNPRTKKFFPPDFMFDPFTGEKLVWHNPGVPYQGGSSVEPATRSQKQPATSKSSSPDKGTKKSNLGKLNKNYVKESISPFSSSEKQIDAAKKIADEITK